MYLQLPIIRVNFIISGNNHLSDNDRIVIILTMITFENTSFDFRIANLLLTDALNVQNAVANVF